MLTPRSTPQPMRSVSWWINTSVGQFRGMPHTVPQRVPNRTEPQLPTTVPHPRGPFYGPPPLFASLPTLIMLPGIISQRNYVHRNPSLGVSLGGTQTKTGVQAGLEREEKKSYYPSRFEVFLDTCDEGKSCGGRGTHKPAHGRGKIPGSGEIDQVPPHAGCQTGQPPPSPHFT